MGLRRYAVFNDIHFPYESKAYYRAIKIIQTWDNLAGIILNGDIAEIVTVSIHPKNPELDKFLNKEIDYTNSKFDDIQSNFQDIPVAYLEGNHEARIFRFIRDQCPQLWGLIDTPKLFRFDERPGWKFFRHGPQQLVRIAKTDLYCRHEPLAMGQNPAKITAENSYVDIIFGHVHTYQEYTHKKFGPVPKTTRAYANGWLGDKCHSIFDYRGPRDRWVEGFGDVLVDDISWEYQYNFVDLSHHNPFYEAPKQTTR